MTLLQIHEPGQTPSLHEENDMVAVGIDLGTTNSLIAYCDQGNVRVIPVADNEMLYPSVIAFDGDSIHTGHDALNYVNKPDVDVIRSVKRLMGRGKGDVKKISGTLPYAIDECSEDGIVRLKTKSSSVTPIEISAHILDALKQIAEREISKPIDKAVITVPAYFDDAARVATKNAAKIAGIDVLRLINEPTAAALAYGLDKGSEGIYAVYDLGGGTFDISLLKMENGIFQVLATGGNTSIGGDDFDKEIAELLLWQYKNRTQKPYTPTQRSLNGLLISGKKVKEYLSKNDTGSFEVEINQDSQLFEVCREDFNKAIMPYVEATIDSCKQVISDAKIGMNDIKGVILVGGATRVPLVREKVKEFFGQQPLDDVDPDQVVAKGAAIQAEGLTKGSSNLLLDVLPLSLGIEVMGELVEKIIPRNTPIPVSRAQDFTTYKDNQIGIHVHVLQGERETVAENRSLAKFEFKGISPRPAGLARLRITFTVDADGLLTVSATENETNAVQTVEVNPSFGLTEDEIKNMLYDAMKNAQKDMQTRSLAEARIEAKRLITSVKSALGVDVDLLTESQKCDIEDQIAKTEASIVGDDREDVDYQSKLLQEVTQDFAKLRVDKYTSSSLHGRHIDEVDS